MDPKKKGEQMRAAKGPHPTPKQQEEYRTVSDEDFTDSHDALAKAYLAYFDAYFLYIKKGSIRSYYECQKQLRTVIEQAKIVQKDCQDNFYKDRKRPGVYKQRKLDAQQKQNKR